VKRYLAKKGTEHLGLSRYRSISWTVRGILAASIPHFGPTHEGPVDWALRTPQHRRWIDLLEATYEPAYRRAVANGPGTRVAGYCL
jgi:hypothetical protein